MEHASFHTNKSQEERIMAVKRTAKEDFERTIRNVISNCTKLREDYAANHELYRGIPRIPSDSFYDADYGYGRRT